MWGHWSIATELMKIDSSSSSGYQLSIGLQLRVEIWECLPTPNCNVDWLELEQALCRQLHSCSDVMSEAALSGPEDTVLLLSLPDLWLFPISVTSSEMNDPRAL